MSSTWRIYLLSIISFLVGTSEYIISGILDKIAASLDITVVAAGQLITVFSFVYALGTPVLMALTARLDRRKLLVYGLAVFTLANVLSFVLPGFGLFVAARILMAFGAGVVVVTALSVSAKIAPAGKQASAIATVIMGFTASLIIGVPLGRMIAEAYDWRSVFAGIALAGLAAIVILYRAVPPTPGDQPVPLAKQLAMMKKPRVALGLAVTFFWLGGYSVAYTYISPYLTAVAGVSEQLLSVVLLVFGVASLAGSKFGGYSTDRWGVAVTLLAGMALHIAALLGLSFVGGWLPAVLVALVLWSFSAWSSGPAQQYHLATLEPESSGVMLGLNQSMMQLSMAAGAAFGGGAVAKISLASVTWLGALGVAVAMAALALSLRLARFSSPTKTRSVDITLAK